MLSYLGINSVSVAPSTSDSLSRRAAAAVGDVFLRAALSNHVLKNKTTRGYVYRHQYAPQPRQLWQSLGRADT